MKYPKKDEESKGKMKKEPTKTKCFGCGRYTENLEFCDDCEDGLGDDDF